MANKRFFFGMLVIVLAFGMMVVGCDNGSTNNDSKNNDPPYTEEDVYISSLGVMMHYYFSSTPEGIEQAAFDNGISYINPPIKNAAWTLNPSLDTNVKNAMDSRKVSYSGTVYVEDGITYIIVNRKANDGSWYSTLYTLT
jgi:hypothetical protein